MSGDMTVSSDRVDRTVHFAEQVDSGRGPGWFEADCDECDWCTTGRESVVEEAAYEHVEMAHPPRRIQRRRTRGWRMPAGAIYVGRPGTKRTLLGRPIPTSRSSSRDRQQRQVTWGNPYVVGQTMFSPSGEELVVRDRAHAVELFREWITQPQREPRLRATREHLAGHDLVCCCPLDAPCHGDVLLELANGGDR